MDGSLRHIVRLFLYDMDYFSFFDNSVHMKGKFESFAYEDFLRNVEKIQSCNELLALHCPVLSSANNVSSSYVVEIGISYQNLDALSCLSEIDFFFIFV